MAALTYKKAAVDIDEEDKFIKMIKPLLGMLSAPSSYSKSGIRRPG